MGKFIGRSHGVGNRCVRIQIGQRLGGIVGVVGAGKADPGGKGVVAVFFDPVGGLVAYKGVDAIDWPQGFCRRDIGWRAIKY